MSPHSPRAFGGDGHVESSGDPTAELPAVTTAHTAHTAHSTFARSTASRSLVANNRVRLEDLVTEHELGDSSEVVARRVAGYLDLVASIALPLAYLLFILVYLLQFEAASMIQRSTNRNALSTPRAGSTRRTRTTSGGRSSSTSRRSASRRRSAASGGGRRRARPKRSHSRPGRAAIARARRGLAAATHHPNFV